MGEGVACHRGTVARKDGDLLALLMLAAQSSQGREPGGPRFGECTRYTHPASPYTLLGGCQNNHHEFLFSMMPS